MAATKESIIGYALDDIGYSGEYDATLQARGLRTLDSMMYSWLLAGIDLDYLVDATSELTDDSGLLPQYIEAVQTNLACRLADQLSVMVPQSYRALARKLYNGLIPVTPIEVVANPFMPVGAGNTRGCGELSPYQNLDLTADVVVTVTDEITLDD